MENLSKLMCSIFLLIKIYFIQVTASSADEEPRCESKCDFDLKRLEKIAKMENEISQFLEIIQLQKIDIERHQSDLEILNNKLTELQPKPTIAFLAELTTSMAGSDYRVYFRNVKLNLGNAYYPNHGLFIAPLNGTYLFTITVCSSPAKHITLELVVNNSGIDRLLAGDDTYGDCNSKQHVVHLQAGDDVFIRHGGSGSYLNANPSYGYPAFMGVLLQAH